MTQLEQAMEVVKDLTQMKARLIKDRTELGSTAGVSLHTNIYRSSIDEMTRHKLRNIGNAIDNLIEAVEILERDR